MDPLAFGFVALAAVLHATWNIMIKTAGDPLRASTVALVSGALVAGALGIAGWAMAGGPSIPAQVWLLGIVSGGVETLYFVFLSAAYRRGDLSVVYPLARGTTPILTVLIGVLLLGERLPPGAAVGVGLLVIGLLLVQRPWRLLAAGSAVDRAAAGFALLTGLMTATYSGIDRVAVQQVSPWLYVAILWPATAAGLVLVAVARHARGDLPAREYLRDPARGVVAGLFTLGAYACVLAALSIAPLAIIGPLRQSAVLLISGWGIVRLREAVDRTEIAYRLSGAVIVVAGAAVLAVAS